jgi:coenzyme F420-dependent oxidoreductase
MAEITEYEAAIELSLPAITTPSLDRVLTLGRRAEELGYDGISIPEVSGRDAVSVLGAMAPETDEITLANDVFSIYSRSPTLLAQTGATLQELSGGRFRLGVGMSSEPLVRNWLGESFDRPLRRLRETIEIMHATWTGDPVNYDGDIFELEGMRLGCEPPDPAPPIDVGTLGPTATELTGRFADGWFPQLFSFDGLEDRLADLHRGCELADRDPDEVRVTLGLRCFASDDPEAARKRARKDVAFMIGAYGPYYRQSIAEQGYEDVTQNVRSAWKDDDRDAMRAAIPDELLDQLVAVGSPADVRNTVKSFASVDDVDAVRVVFLNDSTEAEQDETISAVAG